MLQCYFLVSGEGLRNSQFTGKDRKRKAGAKDPSGAERNGAEHVSGPESEGSRGRARETEALGRKCKVLKRGCFAA